MKSGNLNFLGPSGPLQACNGTDFLHTDYVGECRKRSDVSWLRGRLSKEIGNFLTLLATIRFSRPTLPMQWALRLLCGFNTLIRGYRLIIVKQCSVRVTPRGGILRLWICTVTEGEPKDGNLKQVTTPSFPLGRLQLKCDGTRWRSGGEVKGKLANGVGSLYPPHYLGT